MGRLAASLLWMACAAGCGGSMERSTEAALQPVAGGVRLVDLDGQPTEPLAALAQGTAVFVFVRSECPIANRYAPELARLHARFAEHGVGFWAVYVDPDQSAEVIRQHRSEFGHPFPALRDPQHALVDAVGAEVTPEVAIFHEGDWIYRGRIDDRYTGFGQYRQEPSRRDVEEVLDALTDGQSIQPRRTQAVGCFIADLRPAGSAPR